MTIGEFYQSGDWKGEKHVPVIDAPENVEKDKDFMVNVEIGKEIPHPNEMEHHIVWIKLYYKGEDEKFPVELGTYNFRAHGEGDAFAEPKLNVQVKLNKSGTLIATSYCNIHGLWENSQEVTVK
ncbi:MAG: class II SORL domain-containing protein [Tissierellia bacterium]|nr:class II SORL domain-containing protein [Tissierellia bacterium]MDO5755794.1 class II SORL domain-containing protein [Tissierellia bacterium]